MENYKLAKMLDLYRKQLIEADIQMAYCTFRAVYDEEGLKQVLKRASYDMKVNLETLDRIFGYKKK